MRDSFFVTKSFTALEILKRGLNDLKYLTEVVEQKFIAAEKDFHGK